MKKPLVRPFSIKRPTRPVKLPKFSKTGIQDVVRSINETARNIRIFGRVFPKSGDKTDLIETGLAERELVFPEPPADPTFHPFPKLPVELRIKIWQLAAINHKARVVTLSAIPPAEEGSSPWFFEFDQGFPPVLEANGEAFHEAQKQVYSIISGQNERFEPIAFNYSKDMLFLDASFCEDNNSSYLTILDLMTPAELAQITTLGIQLKFNWGRLYIGHMLQAMPSLKKLYFSVYPGRGLERRKVSWHICPGSHREKWVTFVHHKLLDYQWYHPEWTIPDVEWVRPVNIGIEYEEEKACVCGGCRYGLVPVPRRHSVAL